MLCFWLAKISPLSGVLTYICSAQEQITMEIVRGPQLLKTWMCVPTVPAIEKKCVGAIFHCILWHMLTRQFLDLYCIRKWRYVYTSVSSLFDDLDTVRSKQSRRGHVDHNTGAKCKRYEITRQLKALHLPSFQFAPDIWEFFRYGQAPFFFPILSCWCPKDWWCFRPRWGTKWKRHARAMVGFICWFLVLFCVCVICLNRFCPTSKTRWSVSKIYIFHLDFLL